MSDLTELSNEVLARWIEEYWIPNFERVVKEGPRNDILMLGGGTMTQKIVDEAAEKLRRFKLICERLRAIK